MRALKADEIEVRVGQVYNGGVSMLLYKNARTDMAILDETFGAMNWQKDYKEIKGNLYCGVGVWDEDKKEWIWKWDCGTESNTEKEKGEASDAFKRACVNVSDGHGVNGIGRELYTAPFIWLDVATEPIPSNNGYTRYKLHDPKELRDIYVSDIVTEEIDGKLTIKDLELSQRDRYGKKHVIWSNKEGK